MMTDTIADMLTRIRNAKRIYHPSARVPYSNLKEGIAKKLKQEGFIEDYKVVQEEGSPYKELELTLKYGPDGEQIIREIQRVSKPSRRIYKGVGDMEKVLDGLGVSIVSTSKGVLTDRECRENKVGGEVLCVVW